MVATRQNLEYPWVANPRIRNSLLPRESGPKVGFNTSSFIMFDATPGSGHENNFEACKRYRAPRPRRKIKRRKEEDFGHKSFKKNSKDGRCLEWVSINFTALSSKYVQFGYLSVVLAFYIYLFIYSTTLDSNVPVCEYFSDSIPYLLLII